MSDSQSIKIDSLLLDLFQELRKAGMSLTLEQYHLLQQAVTCGYGLGGWEDIKRVCRLLWVKPCDNYDINIFNRTFESYIRQHHTKMPVESVEQEPQSLEKTSPIKPPANLPQIPPRKQKSPSTDKPGEAKVPVAMQTSAASPKFENTRNNFHLSPRDFPIQLQDVQTAWRLLRRPQRIGWDDELDIEATLEQIGREGLFADVVMRPVRTRRTELLLLIDDNLAMIPFFPAFEPFIQAIAEARITPARIYRFTSYPGEYLYYWYRPTLAQSLNDLLPKLHRNRTITLIISDAGAATATYSQERIEGISKFLTALSPCIRQLIWLNPLPPQRWEQTSAITIDAILNGRMLTYEPAGLQTATREMTQDNMIQIWQMYSPTQRNQATEKI
ncbi:MAG: hypothetical protein HC907_28560 [Richelia sp. SM1_7_0]|nr:hypothetical protein [Richelia sp. SM1_7_0]